MLYPIDPPTQRIKLANVTIGETWAAMEKLVPSGKVRSIGISNCTIEKVEELLRTAKITPAVNQYEGHPYLQQPKLFEFLKEKVCTLEGMVMLSEIVNWEWCRVFYRFLIAPGEMNIMSHRGLCPF